MLNWDQEFEEGVSLERTRDLALLILEDVLQDQQCKTLQKAIANREWRTVVEFEPSYNSGVSTPALIALRQALAFFSKNLGIELGIDKEQVAYRKFEESEEQCKITNDAFAAWKRGEFQFSPLVESVFHRAQRKISMILGDVPSLSDLKLRFGPGATASLPKRLAHPRQKLSEGVQCSEDLIRLVPALLREMPSYLDSLPGDEYDAHGWIWKSISCEIQAGKLVFVPKNAKTNRSVVIEPQLNMMLQLGIGDYIADRLRARGLDLRDQTYNQSLARVGSLTGALATLDLSSASDTISSGIVEHLLPHEWFELLVQARSGVVQYGDLPPIELEKFSSMGNGFTFPLETLIFYSLVSSVCEIGQDVGAISVYGDDIICPATAVERVQLVLRSAGFTLNREKSFWTGGFRESCGKDYFRGISVRPVYLKRRLSPQSLYTLHNFFFGEFHTAMCEKIISMIPPALQLWGPPLYGDGHLHTNSWGEHAKHRSKNGYNGWVFETFSVKPRVSKQMCPGDYLFPAYSIYISGRFEPSTSLDDEPPIEEAVSYSYLHDIRFLTGQAQRKQRDDYVWNTPVPGSSGVKRSKIYTFNRPLL